MTYTYINWTCPDCAENNRDEICAECGPFSTCTCGYCGKSFDQSAVKAEIEPAPCST